MMIKTLRRFRNSRQAPLLGLTLALGGLLLVTQDAATAPASDKAVRGGALSGRVTDADTGHALAAARITVRGAQVDAVSAADGSYTIENLTPGSWRIECWAAGYRIQVRSGIEISGGRATKLDFALQPIPANELAAPETDRILVKAMPSFRMESQAHRLKLPAPYPPADVLLPPFNTESYHPIDENRFRSATDEPLSTFSIDVDTAAYANTRRFIEKEHRLPPVDAVRIEELINYFSYDYADPQGAEPFSVVTEVSVTPWNPSHRLVHIGLQGRRVETDELPPSNLVFLLDVSGSMNSPAKLPLLKAAFRLLVENLRAEDRVAIVVYAGAAGVVLPPTPGSDKETILQALDGLRAGGSTAGGAGIRLAYDIASRNFDPEANNRVILATDGDFNIGPSSDAEMLRLIESRRDRGVFLSVLGFGTGNYKDSKMETLADHGNGVASYIDGILEAKKVLVSELGGTLHTIAKDVKIQVEFNPARVKGYRLIGYENRRLRNQDFNDDAKDAGELGAGHSVTVLYEIVPAGSGEKLSGVDELKYQESRLSAAGRASDELLTVKLRYKEPHGDASRLVTRPLLDRRLPLDRTSDDFRFSAAVAEFGMLLRGSDLKGEASFESVLAAARGALASDPGGYRAEFLELVEQARLLAGAPSAS